MQKWSSRRRALHMPAWPYAVRASEALPFFSSMRPLWYRACAS